VDIGRLLLDCLEKNAIDNVYHGRIGLIFQEIHGLIVRTKQNIVGLVGES
jgi:hypothetical protein